MLTDSEEAAVRLNLDAHVGMRGAATVAMTSTILAPAAAPGITVAFLAVLAAIVVGRSGGAR